MFPNGTECPAGVGTEDIAGCGTKDKLLRATSADKDGQEFELWCVDEAHFSVRFIKRDDNGVITDEKWIGVCPYNGGQNGAEAIRKNVPGGFLWKSAYYLSLDGGADDDGDRRQDKVQFWFDATAVKLLGRHSDPLLDDTEWWDGAEGGDVPDIPGDGEGNVHDAWMLLGTLTRSRELDPALPNGDECPPVLDTQVIDNSVGTSPDCDDNGLYDEFEIVDNPQLDQNGNSVLDACEVLVPGRPALPVNKR